MSYVLLNKQLARIGGPSLPGAIEKKERARTRKGVTACRPREKRNKREKRKNKKKVLKKQNTLQRKGYKIAKKKKNEKEKIKNYC